MVCVLLLLLRLAARTLALSKSRVIILSVAGLIEEAETSSNDSPRGSVLSIG